MGPILAKMFPPSKWKCNFQTEMSIKILMLGLDSAGKTSVLDKASADADVNPGPTTGFNVETLTLTNGVTFTLWDVGGQEMIRGLWKHYYVGSEGLLFIVDSSDRTRFSEAREELFNIIKSPDMEGVPVVVMANKQDLPQAASTAEIADVLNLRDMRDRKWYVQGACATSGEGIYEGMHEMARLVKEFQRR